MNKLQIQLKKKEKERKDAAGKKSAGSKEDKGKEAAAVSAGLSACYSLPGVSFDWLRGPCRLPSVGVVDHPPYEG
jgi:hypothetical protein